MRKAVILVAVAYLYSSLTSAGMACEWAWISPTRPKLIGLEANITTESGVSHTCSVKDPTLYEPAFTLTCANGSTIQIGRSGYCGPGNAYPACDYSLVTDRQGQQFKMRENLSPGWDRSECANGIATSVMRYHLSQDVFKFDAKIVIRVQEAREITPAGF
jgi:hypothetical protein